MRTDEIVERLEGVSGDGPWKAKCPAHEDRKPSLSISRKDDGSTLVHCHAGCDVQSVTAAIGLTPKDLFDGDTRPNTARRIVKTYPYHNEHGTLCHEAVRYEPKEFRQRRPDGNGGWIWNMKGEDLFPYRLPKILNADPLEPILIVEGEKDADSLVAVGLQATCNIGGAGKWKLQFSKYFKGKIVIVIPDNDDPGRDHAEKVAASLHGTAASVRVLNLPGLPEKGDVSDWLKTGSVDDLRRLAAECPEWSLNRNANDADDEGGQETIEAATDPGPVPANLLTIPGFIDDVVGHLLSTAPYPDRALAFCAALALLSLLTGRKVRDEQDNRTNLFILALAKSGTGKDHGRKFVQRLLHEVGMSECVGDSFASGEGIEDRVLAYPSMLFLTDEIDGLMNKIKEGKEARHEGIMSVWLKMWSSSSSFYPMRVKAGSEAKVIDQPHLVIFGTAIPTNFYGSLPQRMLTNGTFARIIAVEAGDRGFGQDAIIKPIPESITETARWWSEFRPGHLGNLDFKPAPVVVECTAEANEILRSFRTQADQEWSLANGRCDDAGMATWARAHEMARRLALIYACSANHIDRVITADAAWWSCQFVEHQVRRMLWMSGVNVSESQFDAKCKAVLNTLIRWNEQHRGEWMPSWRLTRRHKGLNGREIDEIRASLLEQRLIEFEEHPTGGTPKRLYRLHSEQGSRRPIARSTGHSGRTP